jgi:mutator protein MutT
MSSRAYPDRPFVGVGAVIVDAAARVLLVKRRFEPLAGQWSLPGGGVDVGETLQACVIREMLEETGLEVEVGPVIEVFDRIMHDAEGRVQYHYVLVDYVCRPAGGTLAAASDVADVAWANPGALGEYQLTDKAVAVIHQGLTLAAQAGWTERSAASSRKGI